MNTTEIKQRLNHLYNELTILETPWKNLVNKYHSLQSNPETANTEETKQYHNEIISIQKKIKEIRIHIHQLESLFSEEPLQIKTDYTEENAYIIKKAFEQSQKTLVDSTTFNNEPSNYDKVDEYITYQKDIDDLDSTPSRK